MTLRVSAVRPAVQPARFALCVAAAAALLALAACGAVPKAAPATGLLDLLDQPAERALSDGIRAYDDALYTRSEAALRRALAIGLASSRDRANAYKLLGFITCASERINECEAALLAARAADPAFVLSRAEAGHPVWGPVYRRVLP
jgi:hypothetical protein